MDRNVTDSYRLRFPIHNIPEIGNAFTIVFPDQIVPQEKSHRTLSLSHFSSQLFNFILPLSR